MGCHDLLLQALLYCVFLLARKSESMHQRPVISTTDRLMKIEVARDGWLVNEVLE